MEDPWIIFLDELRERAEDIPYQEFNREEEMVEAAHEAHEATSDLLHEQLGWSEDDALDLSSGFGQVVHDWIAEGALVWQELEERLEDFQEEWDREMGSSLA